MGNTDAVFGSAGGKRKERTKGEKCEVFASLTKENERKGGRNEEMKEGKETKKRERRKDREGVRPGTLRRVWTPQLHPDSHPACPS